MAWLSVVHHDAHNDDHDMDHDDDDVNEDTAADTAAEDSADARKRRSGHGSDEDHENEDHLHDWYSDNHHDNSNSHSIEWANWFVVSASLFRHTLALCHRVSRTALATMSLCMPTMASGSTWTVTNGLVLTCACVISSGSRKTFTWRSNIPAQKKHSLRLQQWRCCFFEHTYPSITLSILYHNPETDQIKQSSITISHFHGDNYTVKSNYFLRSKRFFE